MIPKKIPTEDTPAAGVMKSSKIVEVIICDPRGIPVKGMLPPQLEGFAEMLSCLEWYFLQAWHDLGVIGRQHQFHAHNAIQAVLLKEIKKLQTSGDDIELNPTPLGLDSDIAAVPDPSSYVLKTNAPDDTEDDVQVKKKRKVSHETDSFVDKNLISRDNPQLKDFMSVIDCNHDSKSGSWATEIMLNMHLWRRGKRN